MPISVLFTGNHFKPEKYENESAIFYKDTVPTLDAIARQFRRKDIVFKSKPSITYSTN